MVDTQTLTAKKAAPVEHFCLLSADEREKDEGVCSPAVYQEADPDVEAIARDYDRKEALKPLPAQDRCRSGYREGQAGADGYDARKHALRAHRQLDNDGAILLAPGEDDDSLLEYLR
jgi:hypothetical protein